MYSINLVDISQMSFADLLRESLDGYQKIAPIIFPSPHLNDLTKIFPKVISQIIDEYLRYKADRIDNTIKAYIGNITVMIWSHYMETFYLCGELIDYFVFVNTPPDKETIRVKITEISLDKLQGKFVIGDIITLEYDDYDWSYNWEDTQLILYSDGQTDFLTGHHDSYTMGFDLFDD